MVNAHNVLIIKLGLIPQDAEIDNSAVAMYNNLFEQGLSPSQVEAINELFKDRVPEHDESGDEEDEVDAATS